MEEAAGAAVRTGLLLTAFSTTGVDSLDPAALLAVPDAAGFAASPIDAPIDAPVDASVDAPGVHPPDLRVVPDPDDVAKRVAAATEGLADAEREVEAAGDALASARAEVVDLEARSLQVQAEIDELRRRLAEHEEQQDEIDEELTDAQHVVESARDDVRMADAARSRAAAALTRLSG